MAGIDKSKIPGTSSAKVQYKRNQVPFPKNGIKGLDKINAGDLFFLSPDGTEDKINHVGIVTSFINNYDPVTKKGTIIMDTIEGNYGNVVRERKGEIIYKNGRRQQLQSDRAKRYVVGFNDCQ